MIITSASSNETKKIAELLGQSILRGGSGPFIVALEGDLGAGKTTFIKGLARGLGIRRNITSPTFLMVRRYKLPPSRRRFKNLYHVDAYRMGSARDIVSTGLKEALRDKQSVIAVEWADRIKKALPRKIIRVVIAHQKENERRLSFSSKRK